MGWAVILCIMAFLVFFVDSLRPHAGSPLVNFLVRIFPAIVLAVVLISDGYGVLTVILIILLLSIGAHVLARVLHYFAKKK